MNQKASFSLVLTGPEAESFYALKSQLGWEHASNVAALRMLISTAAKNPAGLLTAKAEQIKHTQKVEEKQDAKPAKRLADRPTWMEFSKLISTWGDQITPYWDERAAQIYQHGSIMGNETPLQTKRKFDGALKFLEDWDLWMEGEFTPYGETYAEWIQHATPFAENFTPPSLPTLAELEAQHAINQGTHSDAQNS